MDSSRVIEAFCRTLPEVIAGVTFALRRRNVDCRNAETILAEFGVESFNIQNQRALINELVDFEGIKRDWDNAFLMCFLSYVVLAFVASPKILFSGLGVWIIVFVVVKLRLREDGPGDRFRSRRLAIIAIMVVLVISALGKITTVFWH